MINIRGVCGPTPIPTREKRGGKGCVGRKEGIGGKVVERRARRVGMGGVEGGKEEGGWRKWLGGCWRRVSWRVERKSLMLGWGW